MFTSNPFRFYALLISGLLAFLLSGCLPDDPEPINNAENINAVVLRFSGTDGSTVTAEWIDDGLSDNVDTIFLQEGTGYRLDITFQNRGGDLTDFTSEITREDEEHLVCFLVPAFITQPLIIDADAALNPVGLESNLATTNAGVGSFTVTLRHQPNKTALNACSTGQTDVEAVFPVVVR